MKVFVISMFENISSFLIAFLGLGFLVFVHELGHLLMALYVGMRVEAFGIGFGRPLFTFKCRNIPINICPIPFGGYVKIAGMESKKGAKTPDTNGFFSKTPLARMAVALAGPGANILFALLAFTVIYMMGGRQKLYHEITPRIGMIEKASDLYKKGIRAGDTVVSYNGKPVMTAKDHAYAAMTSGAQVHMRVLQESEGSSPQEKELVVSTYQDPRSLEKGILTAGVLSSAGFVVYQPPLEPQYQKLKTEAETEYGILPKDRVVWADGQNVFSVEQLSSIINENRVYLTVLRNGSYVHVRIPRVKIFELVLPKDVYGELSDWRYEANLQKKSFKELWYIPYDISVDCIVSKKLSLFEQTASLHDEGGDQLLPNDTIVAIFGETVRSASDLLAKIQEKKALLIVDRIAEAPFSSFEKTDASFMKPFYASELKKLIAEIGTPAQKQKENGFVLLRPVVLKNYEMVSKSLGKSGEEKEEEARLLRNIEDPALRSDVEKQLQMRDKQVYLGLFGMTDRACLYNPTPFAMFRSVIDEVYQTISALIGGSLSPRWMSGPVGIVQVIQKQISYGFLEVLFWLGAISLNLAILNLLPFPVLDGGYIFLSLFEICTGVRVKAETIEKIVLPFALVFIAFLLYVTYHDIARLLVQVFQKWG